MGASGIDDQCRGPSIKEKDHLAVVLTNMHLDIESYRRGGHDDDKGLAGKKREDQTTDGLPNDRTHHSKLASLSIQSVLSFLLLSIKDGHTCVLIVEVAKCNRRQNAGEVEENCGRDGFLTVQMVLMMFSGQS